MPKKTILLWTSLLLGIGLIIALYFWKPTAREDFPIYLQNLPGSNPEIGPIVFGKDGTPWVGTSSGLRMFNGKNWPTYNRRNSGLVGEMIDSLGVDSQGRIWVGASTFISGEGYVGTGVSIFDGKNWTTYSQVNSGLPSNRISVIAFDAQDNAWLASEDGDTISKFDGKVWKTYSAEDFGLRYLSGGQLAIDQKGRVWAGTSGGVYYFDGSKWIKKTEQEHIQIIAFDRGGRLWIGTYNQLYVFEDEKLIGEYPTNNSGLVNNRFEAIAFDQQNRAWIGTWEGVSVFDGKSWRYAPSPHKIITNLSIDNKNNVWVGGSNTGGLWVLPIDDEIFSRSSSPQAVYIKAFLSYGGLVYLALILCGLWLSVALRGASGIRYGVIIGSILFILVWIMSGPSDIPSLDDLSFLSFTFNPGVFVTAGSLIGGLLSRIGASRLSTDKLRKRGNKGVTIGLVTGLAAGICAALPLLLAQ